MEDSSQGSDLSIVLPTYAGDDPDNLSLAIESLANQSVPPGEVLIVKDGPLTPKIREVIESWRTRFPTGLSTYQIETNRGLGNALRVGVEQASYDLVARMDADDISVPNRLGRQLGFLSNNPEVDVVGGYVVEFDEDPNAPTAKRKVPTTHDEIVKLARFRSPMNHATVMFDRERVLEAGNYRDVARMEDYDLWVRMFLDGATFANIPEVLVKVRAGDAMYERRGGLEYAREELRTQSEFYDRGFISFPVFAFNVLTRGSLRLLPARLRGWVYSTVARDS